MNAGVGEGGMRDDLKDERVFDMAKATRGMRAQTCRMWRNGRCTMAMRKISTKQSKQEDEDVRTGNGHAGI